jgi:FkbM family methyltransferase
MGRTAPFGSKISAVVPRENVAGKGIRLVEKAVGRQNGEVTFYLDSLTGQNNSLLKDFEGLKANTRNAFVTADVKEVVVQMVRLDDYFAQEGVTPSFIKVDVEGAELDVLRGATGLITEAKPAWTVEVQSSQDEIHELFTSASYVLFDDHIRRLESPEKLRGNVFAFHRVKHAKLLTNLGVV